MKTRLLRKLRRRAKGEYRILMDGGRFLVVKKHTSGDWRRLACGACNDESEAVGVLYAARRGYILHCVRNLRDEQTARRLWNL